MAHSPWQSYSLSERKGQMERLPISVTGVSNSDFLPILTKAGT